MDANIKGNSGFSYLEVNLDPGETVVAESDAMSSMSTAIDMESSFNGGIIGGLLRKFLGKESLFINKFENKSAAPASMTLVQPYPGGLRSVELYGDEYFLQPGAFVACTEGVKMSLKWAGIASFIGREGLFRISVSGQGTCWYGAYGALLERTLEGETIVDTSHLVSYDPTIKLNVQLAGGIVSSILGGEGLVTRISGEGKYVIQTRSIESLASWLNPKFW